MRQGDKYVFECHSCHLKRNKPNVPYYVREYTSYKLIYSDVSLYQGLYYAQTMKPVYTNHISILGTLMGTLHSFCDTSPLLVIQFRLSTLPLRGSVGNAINAWLEGYFVDRPANLTFIDIDFNLRTQQDVYDHANRMDEIMKQLTMYA